MGISWIEHADLIDLAHPVHGVLAGRFLGAHGDMEQRKEMVHHQQLDILLEPPQGEDVVAERDVPRRAKQVPGLAVPVEVNDVFVGVVAKRPPHAEEAPPLFDAPLAVQEREDGLRGNDLVAGDGNLLAVLVVGVAAGGFGVADLDDDAVGGHHQVEQDFLEKHEELLVHHVAHLLHAPLDVLYEVLVVSHHFRAVAEGERQFPADGLLVVRFGVEQRPALKQVVFRFDEPHVSPIGVENVLLVVELAFEVGRDGSADDLGRIAGSALLAVVDRIPAGPVDRGGAVAQTLKIDVNPVTRGVAQGALGDVRVLQFPTVKPICRSSTTRRL